jgi:hypothetical protein
MNWRKGEKCSLLQLPSVKQPYHRNSYIHVICDLRSSSSNANNKSRYISRPFILYDVSSEKFFTVCTWTLLWTKCSSVSLQPRTCQALRKQKCLKPYANIGTQLIDSSLFNFPPRKIYSVRNWVVPTTVFNQPNALTSPYLDYYDCLENVKLQYISGSVQSRPYFLLFLFNPLNFQHYIF